MLPVCVDCALALSLLTGSFFSRTLIIFVSVNKAKYLQVLLINCTANIPFLRFYKNLKTRAVILRNEYGFVKPGKCQHINKEKNPVMIN